MMLYFRLSLLGLLLSLTGHAQAQSFNWDNLEAMNSLLQDLSNQPVVLASLTGEVDQAATAQYRSYTERLRLISNQVNDAFLAKQRGDYGQAEEKLRGACGKLSSLRDDIGYDLRESGMSGSLVQQLEALRSDVEIVISGIGCSAGGSPGGEIPYCRSPASDPDGDGWGWENNASCKVHYPPTPETNCSWNEWYSPQYNRCFAKAGSCQQYDFTDSKTCNSGNDQMQCDWNPSHGGSCYSSGGHSGSEGGDQWWSSIYNKWFPKNGSCEQYNYTNLLTCNNSKDNLQCDWNKRSNTCTADR